ncbi:hypothetical protein NKJ71_09605 [Mesorhizobium sp. M0050]|uniref:hypothetical protein n=1 Tax=Mesorhizobium sp. M0050 TaxID=2956861 RepID=UPI00333AAF63
MSFDDETQKWSQEDALRGDRVFSMKVIVDDETLIEADGTKYRALAYWVTVGQPGPEQLLCNTTRYPRGNTLPMHSSSLFIDDKGIECSAGYRTYSLYLRTLRAKVALEDGTYYNPFWMAACVKSD